MAGFSSVQPQPTEERSMSHHRATASALVALGVRNRGREYAIGAAMAGGIVGAVVGASSARKDQTLIGESYATLGDPTTNGILGALAGGLVGAFVGTWIGRNETTDRWRDVSLSSFKVSVRVP
jgi:hypothetical protein